MASINSKLLYFPIIIAGLLLALIILSCNTNRITYLEFMGNGCIRRQITRKHTDSDIFVDRTSLVMKNGNKSIYIDTFEVKNGVWRKYCCGEWHEYFDKNDFLRKIPIEDCSYNCSMKFKRIPVGLDTINGQIVYKYQIQERDFNYFAPVIYFDPAFGTIKTISPSSTCEEEVLYKYKKGKKTSIYLK